MKYFTISEMLKSDTALKMRIWNGATKEYEDNMRALIENVLDPLRERYGHPIYVSSGYRCPKLNNAVNGAINSQHMRGEAADIHARLTMPAPQAPIDYVESSICGLDPQSLTPYDFTNENLKLARMIIEAGKFDQMILEEVPENSLNPRWIHVTWKRNGWNRHNIYKKVSGRVGYITIKEEDVLLLLSTKNKK